MSPSRVPRVKSGSLPTGSSRRCWISWYFTAQSEHIFIVGNAEVGTHLVFLNVVRTDRDDDLRIVAQLLEHADLAVGLEAGQHPGGVVIIEQLAAEFQIQLAAELGQPLRDVLCLQTQVFVVVKAELHL